MGTSSMKPDGLNKLSEEERDEIDKMIENFTKLLKHEEAYCLKCGSALIGHRTKRSLYVDCPQCGFIGHALLATPFASKKLRVVRRKKA